MDFLVHGHTPVSATHWFNATSSTVVASWQEKPEGQSLASLQAAPQKLPSGP
jgi:hypothetical protein